MEVFRKAFLFVVGVMAIAYEEANKSIQEAAKSIEESRAKALPGGKLDEPILKPTHN